MSLRYSLLGLLAEGPASGYDITKRFQETLAAVWPASHPQIYRELAKLADDGLVEAEAAGARGRKAYKITDTGLATVREWLTRGSVDHIVRSESLIRSFFFWLIEPQEVLRHLEAEQRYFAAQAKLYEDYAAAKDRGEFGVSKQTESARITAEAAVRVNRALAEWAEWAIQRSAQKSQSK